MKPIKTPQEAAADIKDNSSIMIGGFMCCGHPFSIINAIIETGAKNLTLITNDAGYPDIGIGKLICQNRTKKLIVSHIGLNPVAGNKMNSKEMEVVLVPQGTLAERIRAKGAGLGGVLTPTGIGTEVETGKQKITVMEKDYLLETPIEADFALIQAAVCDKYGNCFINKSAKNFNLVMAMAAKTVIVEADKIVEPGEIDPEQITVPGVFITAIVQAKKEDTVQKVWN
ncbi:MAG: CoA transferase subunit A [Elusimicrobiales bacterium]|nr:CoA transferase subunit A [Elusimicrobiales bacterium]